MNLALALADDATLVSAVRAGQLDAFSVLYDRHAPTISGYARRRARSAEDALDVVSEAFARLLSVLQRGVGPQGEVAPYLTRIVRNLAIDRARADRWLTFTDEPTVLEQPVELDDVLVEEVDRRLVSLAYASLPERWQQVLLLTNVKEWTPERVGEAMGVKPNAVTSLAYRAREGLRQAYLQAHLPADVPAGCAPTSARLGTYVRGALGTVPSARVALHLAECEACRAHLRELQNLNSALPDQPPAPARTTRLASVVTDPEPSVLPVATDHDGGIDDVWSSGWVA
jgi:RNA polymerase sigma factor (sigma-70 family)